jgi:hypothetical protein
MDLTVPFGDFAMDHFQDIIREGRWEDRGGVGVEVEEGQSSYPKKVGGSEVVISPTFSYLRSDGRGITGYDINYL